MCPQNGTAVLKGVNYKDNSNSTYLCPQNGTAALKGVELNGALS